MVSQEKPDEQWLIEYVDRLVRLHRLIAAGQGDSDAAEAVRDEMDLPWRKMSEREIALARDLSIDLYTISDPPPQPESLRPEFRSQINAAVDDQKYLEALRLVRENA